MSGNDLSGFSLLDLFRAEAEACLGTLEAGLVSLESTADPAAQLQELMRAAHSIKGAARIVGLEPLVRVAHALEDAFVSAQRGPGRLAPAQVDVLLEGADLLRNLSARPESLAPEALDARATEIQTLVERLRAVAGSASAPPGPEGGPTPAAAPPAPAAPTAPTAPAAAPAAATPGQDATVRVNALSLSRMLAYAGESLVEARRLSAHARSLERLRRVAARLNQTLESAVEALKGPEAERLAEGRALLERLRHELATQGETLESSARGSEDLAGRLYAEVLASRMRPFGEVLPALPRLVRDMARELGRRARLVVRGREVLVDRDVLDRLEAPLGHLVRNALDHGVEPPEEREAAGKPAEGVIEVEARHRGGMLEVVVADDGRGVDLESVRSRVVERRLIAPEIARDLSEHELLEFLFLPGFSTRDQVTEISGRGVGLDVVQRLAQDLGGNASAQSTAGRGTRFTLVLPITRSVVRAALVEVAGEPYAFPLTRIECLVRLEPEAIASTEGREHYLHEGRPVGLVLAAQALGLPAAARAPGPVHAVQLSAGGERYGLAVERFLGEQDLVLRPLDPRLGKVPNLAAAAVLEDGDPVLIVDTDDLVRSVDLLLHQGHLRTPRMAVGEATSHRGRKRVLVVDDSRTVREVERGLLASRGYAVDVAVDGSDAWNAVRSTAYDLVITDVDMPRMNGIELVRHLKQDPDLRRTPVMIVSYKDREEDRQRGLDAGADAYVTKSSFQETGWIQSVVDLVGEP